MSKRGEPKRFVAALQDIAKRTCVNRFNYDQLYSVASDIRLQYDRLQDLIDTLNNQGYLLKKGPKLWELCIS